MKYYKYQFKKLGLEWNEESLRETARIMKITVKETCQAILRIQRRIILVNQ